MQRMDLLNTYSKMHHHPPRAWHISRAPEASAGTMVVGDVCALTCVCHCRYHKHEHMVLYPNAEWCNCLINQELYIHEL